MILHHYPMSPFSEKIRAMLGCTDLAWQSVTVREMPPRPSLDILTGGYRKIPVAQIGADLFCDTRTITTEIAAMAGRPELALENCDAEVNEFVARTDLEIFLACIFSANGKTLLRKMRRDHSLWHIARFFRDRVSLGRKAAVKAAGPKASKRMVHEHLARMEAMLEEDFLFGKTPNIADFSAWHGLWFIRELSESPITRDYPAVDAWMDRIKAFGHGTMTGIGAEEALDRAQNTQPRPLPEQASPASGETVRIAPTDYGREAVTGELVAQTDHRWILRREHPRCGVVHVHFPRQGFALTR